MAEPIKYSDLIQPDESINQAIDQLEKLQDTYKGLSSSLREEASKTKQVLDALNTTTDEGKEAARKEASEIDRLTKQYKELQDVMGKQATELESLKAQKAELQRLRKLELQMLEAEEGSLKQLEAQYKLNRASLDAMSESERNNSEAAKRLIDQTNNLHQKIVMLRAETDKHISVMKQKQKLNNDETNALIKYDRAVAGTTNNLVSYNMAARDAQRTQKQNIIISESAEGSYNQMAALYARNAAEIRKHSDVLSGNNARANELIKTNAELYGKMKAIEELQGRHTLSVGNYGKAWNGLSNSVNQLVREVPNAAVSMNTFFLAISNNIPILFDEIKLHQEKNRILKENGKTAEQLGPKLMGAIFSWNTALMAGVAVMTIYGKEIAQFFSGLFNLKRNLEGVTEAQKSFNLALVEGQKNAQKDIVRLKLLYAAATDVKRSMDERVKAAKILKSENEEAFRNMNTEQILLGKSKDAYDELTKSVIESAKAKAVYNDLVKTYEKVIEIENKILETQKDIDRQGIAGLETLFASVSKVSIAAGAHIVQFGKNMDTYRVQMAKYKKADLETELKALRESIKQKEKLAIEGAILDTKIAGGGGGGGRGERDGNRLERLNLEISKKLAEARTDLLSNEYQKRRQQLQDSLEAEVASIRFKYRETEELVAKGEAAILALRQKHIEDMRKLSVEEALSMGDAYKEEQQLRLDAVRKGSAEELEIRLNILEANREQELLHNQLLNESLRQSDLDINAKFDTERFRLLDETRAKIATRELEIQQDLKESQFDYIRATNAEKTKLMLGLEIERLELILKLNEEATEKMSDAEIKTIQNLIGRYKAEIANAEREEGFDIYRMMGLKLGDAEKASMEKAKDFIIGQIQDIMKAWVQAAEAKVAAQEELVSDSENAVQRELDARNAGYASDIEGAQAKLMQEKQILEEAKAERQKALKAQQAMDSAMQLTSLITASANIWKVMAGAGLFGLIAAPAMIAAMFASFGAAKVKAAQASKLEYGDGGLEMLEGGSHASGNDIPIGTTKDGKRRTAEGGEALAIINKRSTARYKNVLPEIVKSLNKGTFEDNFGNLYPSTDSVQIVNNNIDVSGIGDDVRKIRKNGEFKTYVDAKGRTVVIQGNNTKRILS